MMLFKSNQSLENGTASEKVPQARRAWFDKLTMTWLTVTYNIACPEPAQGKDEAQRSIRTFSEAVMHRSCRPQ
jgi:hypothetical protein